MRERQPSNQVEKFTLIRLWSALTCCVHAWKNPAFQSHLRGSAEMLLP